MFATLAGRPISVAAKGVKAIVGRRQWTVGSKGKNMRSKLEGDEGARGERG